MSEKLKRYDELSTMKDELDRNKGVHCPQPDPWQSFVSGDEASFKELFKKYHREMYGYGIKLCNQPELVKDCIQELFKIIWEKREDLNHVESPNVYLFVSLRRMILKNLKKQKIFRNELPEFNEDALISFGIEEIIITDETKHQQKVELLNALNRLSARQKEVIWLFFYNGMSYSEIEKILSIKRQSVSNLMYRSMETLREILNESEIMKLVVSFLVAFLLFPFH